MSLVDSIAVVLALVLGAAWIVPVTAWVLSRRQATRVRRETARSASRAAWAEHRAYGRGGTP